MSNMQQLWIEEEFPYDGSQLRSLFAYLNYKILGDSIIAWQGPCSIPFEHMADGEDLLLQAEIRGDKMVHFIVELFDRDLYSAVALQRLMASIVKDELQASALLRREGDDLYLEDRKLSISIAARSPVSVMVHFAVNITNAGTPVKTLSLQDLKVEPIPFAKNIMQRMCDELQSILIATRKVRPLP